MGYKLAPSQADLTPLQRIYLLLALPKIQRIMMGEQDTPIGNSSKDTGDNSLLKAKVLQRRGK